jgi:hypothetical protein
VNLFQYKGWFIFPCHIALRHKHYIINRLALLRLPVGDNIATAVVDNIESILTQPGVEEPTNVLLLEVGAVVVESLPVVGVLSDTKVGVSGVVVGRTPGPLSLGNKGRQTNVGLNPGNLGLDVAPSLRLGIVEVVEGHGVDVGKIRVGLDARTDRTKTFAVAAAHGSGSVPVLADTSQNALGVESGAELAQIVDEVALVHTITNGLRAELSPVDDVRGDCRNGGVVDGVVDSLLGLLPDGLQIILSVQMFIHVNLDSYIILTPSPKLVQTWTIRPMPLS